MIEYIYFEVKPIYIRTNQVKPNFIMKAVIQLQSQRTYAPGCAKLQYKML